MSLRAHLRRHRSLMSSPLVVISLMRMMVMVPDTLSSVPVGSRCDAAEHTIRLRPPPNRGCLPASQRMAGEAVARARGRLGAVGDRKGCTHLMMTATHLMPPIKF